MIIDGGIDPMSHDDDMALLEKFKLVMCISRRIKKNQLAAMLNITEVELIKQLMVWGKENPFKIDGDMIVVDDRKNFTAAMDAQISTLAGMKKPKGGKKLLKNIIALTILLVSIAIVILSVATIPSIGIFILRYPMSTFSVLSLIVLCVSCVFCVIEYRRIRKNNRVRQARSSALAG